VVVVMVVTNVTKILTNSISINPKKASHSDCKDRTGVAAVVVIAVTPMHEHALE
jgi:hypothetical protein